MNETYAWAGGSELLHLTPGINGASVIAALPPFEEANRTRALVATLLRDLNARGFTTALPDLPGQGESQIPTDAVTLSEWRAAFAAAVAALPAPVHAIALRSGALVDGDAQLAGRWYLSPQGGDALARELTRLTDADGAIAGNRVAADFVAGLAGAEPATAAPLRVVRLSSEAKPADRIVDAAPLWRRSEPDNDLALAALLAEDIAEWIAACAD